MSHSSGGWKSKIKVPADPVSSEGLLLLPCMAPCGVALVAACGVPLLLGSESVTNYLFIGGCLLICWSHQT